MKWLIASDLHGSAACCEAMLAAFEREGADRLLLLGDVLSPGSRTGKETVAGMLGGMKDRVICVRGNCDTDADQTLLGFPLQEGYIALPVGGGRTVFATHGHIYNSGSLPPGLGAGDILLQGHTHVPQTSNYGTNCCFNPGSVAQPRFGSERGYMTMEEGLFRWLTLDGEEYRSYEL